MPFQKQDILSAVALVYTGLTNHPNMTEKNVDCDIIKASKLTSQNFSIHCVRRCDTQRIDLSAMAHHR